MVLMVVKNVLDLKAIQVVLNVQNVMITILKKITEQQNSSIKRIFKQYNVNQYVINYVMDV